MITSFPDMITSISYTKILFPNSDTTFYALNPPLSNPNFTTSTHHFGKSKHKSTVLTQQICRFTILIYRISQTFPPFARFICGENTVYFQRMRLRLYVFLLPRRRFHGTEMAIVDINRSFSGLFTTKIPCDSGVCMLGFWRFGSKNDGFQVGFAAISCLITEFLNTKSLFYDTVQSFKNHIFQIPDTISTLHNTNSPTS